MKELIILIVITGLIFLLFLVILILNLKKKSKFMSGLSWLLFLSFVCLSALCVYKFIYKSYNKVSTSLKPRSGIAIYEALFSKSPANCVNIINYQDQLIPKVDDAIRLELETCPVELKRILSAHEFTAEKLSAKKYNGSIPYGETTKWFNPASLGDSIMVYEYASDDRRNIQTIWSNIDSTKVFIRDIYD